MTRMASLFKRKNRYYLGLWDRTRTPRGKQVSLGTGNWRTAQALAKQLEARYLLGDWDPWNPDPTELEQEQQPLTLSEARVAFVESRMHLAPQTLQKYRSVTGQLSRHLGDDTLIQSVRTVDVQSFLDGGDRRSVTRKTYFTTLTPFFNWLVSQGHLEASPASGISLARVPATLPRYLTREEVNRLCEMIVAEPLVNPHAAELTSQWLLPVVRCNCILGLRAAEVTHLEWDHVDLDRSILRVCSRVGFTTKSRKDRVIPIPAPVRKQLTALKERSGPVFRSYGGQALHPRYMSRRFKAFARKAGLPESVNFHSLRHTAASWLIMGGASLEATRRYMGHSSLSVTQRYAQLAPGAFADQINQAFQSA